VPRPTDYQIVLVTAASPVEACKIADALLNKKLAACASLVPKVQSRFWWKGKIDSAREALLIVKTKKSHFASVEKCVKSLHSYDVPEIIAVPLSAGSSAYLRWIKNSVE
jgi:periplasmic divalent cation tolerance protein